MHKGRPQKLLGNELGVGLLACSRHCVLFARPWLHPDSQPSLPVARWLGLALEMLNPPWAWLHLGVKIDGWNEELSSSRDGQAGVA